MSKYSVGDFVYYKDSQATVQRIECHYTYEVGLIDANFATEAKEEQIELMPKEAAAAIKQTMLAALKRKADVAQHEYEQACRKYGAN